MKQKYEPSVKIFQLRAAQNEIKRTTTQCINPVSPPFGGGSEEKPIKNEIHYRTISRGRNWTRSNNSR
jgi:hypothetical protein